MFRFLPRLAPLALLLAAAAPAHAGGANLDGQPAPELRLTDGLNGASASTTLASLRGRVVLLKFWLTHCPICRGTLPDYQRLHDRYGRSGVTCLSVVIDGADGVAPYLKEAGWSFPVGCDPDGSNASRFGVGRYPGDYVIGADGIVRASNGFPQEVIDDELRKVRVGELGAWPESLRAVRDLVEAGDYGAALRKAEPAAAAADAAADVKAAVARLQTIATSRQDNRFARVDALTKAGNTTYALAEARRIRDDFKGTSLEARAQAKVDALVSPPK